MAAMIMIHTKLLRSHLFSEIFINYSSRINGLLTAIVAATLAMPGRLNG